MRNIVPELHPKLQQTLDAFAVAGVCLAPAELAWLVLLRKPCDCPSDGSVPWVMGSALEYGGEKFFPLHRLGETWFERAFRLLDGNQKAQVIAYVFAHSKSGPLDVSLRSLVTSEAITDGIFSWYDTTAIHDGQLDALCARLTALDGDADDVPDPEPKRTQSQAQDDTQTPTAAFLATITKAFPGTTPEYWFTGISTADAKAMLDAGNSESFAVSNSRERAIGNYLRAVRWLWIIHRGDHSNG